MLSMTACTEVLEPNVDYGSNTYTNDYSALVKAVNDLQKSLEDRLDALNSLLNAGLLDIKLAIDENTGSIEVLEANTSSGLANIDTSLINGFTAIADSMDSNGDKIVTAMNENGNLLRLTIDNNGKLISTSVADAANGIYVVTNKETGGKDVYVTPEKWAGMDAKAKTAIGNLVKATEVEVEKHQYNAAGEDQADKLSVYFTTGTETELLALNLQTYPDVTGSEKKLLYKLYKVPTEITMNLSSGNVYGDNKVVAYMITDASGKHGKSVTSSQIKEWIDNDTFIWCYTYSTSNVKATVVEDSAVTLTEDSTKALVKVELFAQKQVDNGATKGMTIDQ